MSGADLNFHIGDKVVYPNHGVGVIEQISSRSVGPTVEKFYRSAKTAATATGKIASRKTPSACAPVR
jgi:RNA polymerase-interacting CarD/CdnL/TRCF family regulator